MKLKVLLRKSIFKIKSFLKKIIFKVKKISNSIIHNRILSFGRKILKKIFYKKQINMDFYNSIDELIANIPESNGSNYYQKIDLKIGIITDEYMYNYYKDAVNLVYIDGNNYKNDIDSADILLFVSCWHGMNNDDWRGMTSSEGIKHVISAFKYAKKSNKKTIFQTIEDPSNYELYLPIAKCADYIFTTAVEKVEDYKKDTKNENVFALDYGVNPMFHNPIGFKKQAIKRRDDIFFAGSWAPRYAERCNDAIMLFDGVITSGKRLILVDRNYYIRGYEFPHRYFPYVIPPINHEKLQKVHKLFDWCLNLNSIKYSPTMCAMRVYELQAIGNLMISNYSIAVNNTFPNIFIVKNSNEVSNIIHSYNEVQKYKLQVDGIRNVFSNHTVYDKLNYIFDCINEKKYKSREKNVLVICKKMTKKIEEMYDNQTFANKNILTLESVNKETLKKYDYVAYFSENINYQKHYLEDMINAFKYTDSDFITISSAIVNGKIEGINHDYVTESNNISLLLIDTKRCDVLEILQRKKIKGNGYSIDPFQITEIKQVKNNLPKLSVIVPVYNNGKFLLYKCFNSLLRSTMFNKMEIILVDDGSKDKNTIDIINELAQKYSNVKTYFFKDNGSGTASRPRNKGVELAKAEYVTYLDPDNEAIDDAYAKLYEIIKNNDYDFVFGSIIKLDETEATFSYYSSNKEILNPRSELINKNFKTNSIQACIIKKKLITKNKIVNPIGAAGQDSLFFQELMINANKVYYLNLPVHIYYAARNDSIVNSINHKFFGKFLIMEKYQVAKLKEYGLFKEYKQRRYYNFLENWYYAKLKLVKDNKEYEESKKIIEEIKKLYE